MKKFLIGFLLTLLVLIPAFTNDIDSENSIVIENEKLDNNVSIESAYNPIYDNIRVYIYYDKVLNIDEGVLENYYQTYMYNWIRNSKHRYYKYITISRNHYFKKYFKDDYRNVYEIFALVMK